MDTFIVVREVEPLVQVVLFSCMALAGVLGVAWAVSSKGSTLNRASGIVGFLGVAVASLGFALEPSLGWGAVWVIGFGVAICGASVVMDIWRIVLRAQTEKADRLSKR